ncbi:MAG: hypothetical protein ACXW1B_03655 [Nitrososphaeraceae archaeon]
MARELEESSSDETVVNIPESDDEGDRQPSYLQEYASDEVPQYHPILERQNGIEP